MTLCNALRYKNSSSYAVTLKTEKTVIQHVVFKGKIVSSKIYSLSSPPKFATE